MFALTVVLTAQADVDALARMARNPKTELKTRVWAVEALRPFPLERTREIFQELLQSKEPAVAAAALTSLAPLKDPELGQRAVDILISDAGVPLKQAAVEVLRQRGDQQGLLVCMPRPEGRLRASIVAALRAGDKAALRKAARASTVGRDLAIEAAGRDPEAYDALETSLHDDSADIRAAAAAALGTLGDRRAVDPLASAAAAGNRAAIDALATLAPDRLAPLLAAEDSETRLWALTAPGAIPAASVAPALRSTDWRERTAAVRRLLRDGSPEALALLTEEDLAERRPGGTVARTADGPIRLDHRRVIFLLDVSGSMKLDLRKALAPLLDPPPPGLRFTLMYFNDTTFWLETDLMEATPRAVKRALGAAATWSRRGPTDLGGALLTALEHAEADTLVVISDGVPTAGAAVEPDEILQRVTLSNRLRQMVIHSAAPRPSDLLRTLALQNHGRASR